MDTVEWSCPLGAVAQVDGVVIAVGEAEAEKHLARSLGSERIHHLPDVFRFLRPRCDRIVAGVVSRIAGSQPLA
jgi:hypothetical protein